LSQRNKEPSRGAGGEAPAALREVVGFRLRRLQNLFQAHWQRSIEAGAVSVSQVQGGVLLLIEENPHISQITLSGLLKIEPPTLLQSLRPLIQKGLVTRKRSTADNRVFELTLTHLGKRVAAWIRVWTPAQEADFLSELSDSERKRLLALLEKAIRSGESALERGGLRAGPEGIPSAPEALTDQPTPPER